MLIFSYIITWIVLIFQFVLAKQDSAINVCDDSVLLVVNETTNVKLKDALSGGQLQWTGRHPLLSSWVGSLGVQDILRITITPIADYFYYSNKDICQPKVENTLYFKGCFDVDLAPYRRFTVLENEALKCQFYCNTTKIGIKMDICICFGGDEIDTSHWKKDDSCLTCTRAQEQLCGSNTSVSVYSKVRSQPPIPDNPDERCATINCTNRMCLYYQDRCSTKHYGICEPHIVSKTTATWNGNMHMCRNGGSFMVGIRNVKDFLSYGLTSGTRYWVNMFRNYVDLNTVFVTPNDGYKCLTKRVDSSDNGDHAVVAVPLYNNFNICLKIICREDTTLAVTLDTTQTEVPSIFSTKSGSNSSTNKNNDIYSPEPNIGVIIATTIVSVIFVAGITVALVLMRKRRKRMLRKRSSRIAIIPPTVAVNPVVRYQVNQQERDCDAENMSNTSGINVDDTDDISGKIQNFPYHEMRPSIKEIVSGDLDFTYTVPVYQSGTYIHMQNLENGDFTDTDEVSLKNIKTENQTLQNIGTKDSIPRENVDKGMSCNDDGETADVKAYKGNNVQLGIEGETSGNAGSGNTEDDFEPDYYPVVYNSFETKLDEKNMTVEAENETCGQHGGQISEKFDMDCEIDFEPDYYPVVYNFTKKLENDTPVCEEETESDFEPENYYPVGFDLMKQKEEKISPSENCTRVSKTENNKTDEKSSLPFELNSKNDYITSRPLSAHNERYDFPKIRREMVMGAGEVKLQQEEPIYDIPPSQAPAADTIKRQIIDEEIFNTYDMADFGKESDVCTDDSIYEPINYEKK